MRKTFWEPTPVSVNKRKKKKKKKRHKFITGNLIWNVKSKKAETKSIKKEAQVSATNERKKRKKRQNKSQSFEI